jgi:hypothetical protein
LVHSIRFSAMAKGSDTSAEQKGPVWTRWLLPSIADSFFISLLAMLTLTSLSVRFLGDGGIGWHIRTGQIILATREIPRVDSFSASMGGHAWYAWEWLYDVLAGWLESAAGLNGVVWFAALVVAVVFAWTLGLLLRRRTNLLLALILVLLAASAMMIHLFARPHVLSWLFTVAWLWILESSEECSGGALDSSRSNRLHNRLWMLPPLMLVWLNVHGGFLVGFVLLAIYWCSAALHWSRLSFEEARSVEVPFDEVLGKIWVGRRVSALTWIGVLSMAATFANPYGWRLHVHIYRYLSNRFLMDHIDEFQSPNFHYVAQKCFAGLLLLTLVALAAKAREVKVSDLLIVAFAAYSGLYASRNIPVSSLLLILIIGPWLSDAVRRCADRLGGRRGTAHLLTRPAMFMRRMKEFDLRLRGHLWPIAAILLSGWIVAHGGKLGATPLMHAQFDAKRFPVAAVNYIEKEGVQGPVLSPDYWGGYFIYRLYPRAKVVIDDRHDFYGEVFLKSYLKMVHLEPGWQEFLQQHPAQFVVIPKGSALDNLLSEKPGWKRVYGDDVAEVFRQTGDR